jgi:hypothetical protein
MPGIEIFLTAFVCPARHWEAQSMASAVDFFAPLYPSRSIGGFL